MKLFHFHKFTKLPADLNFIKIYLISIHSCFKFSPAAIIICFSFLEPASMSSISLILLMYKELPPCSSSSVKIKDAKTSFNLPLKILPVAFLFQVYLIFSLQSINYML